jgi:hypothetical protein
MGNLMKSLPLNIEIHSSLSALGFVFGPQLANSKNIQLIPRIILTVFFMGGYDSGLSKIITLYKICRFIIDSI